MEVGNFQLHTKWHSSNNLNYSQKKNIIHNTNLLFQAFVRSTSKKIPLEDGWMDGSQELKTKITSCIPMLCHKLLTREKNEKQNIPPKLGDKENVQTEVFSPCQKL